MTEEVSSETFGIYLHLPFCRSRCPYCDFFSTQVREIPAAIYTAALHREWRARQEAFEGLCCETIYVGGGTPSLWSAEELSRLLHPFLELGAREVTVEVNPADGDASWFARLVGLGVTRFSMGVQSLDDERLALLGRRHDSDQALRALDQALGSGARVSADFIFATPDSDSELIAAEVQSLAASGIEHMSAYELTLVQGTPLFSRVRSTQLKVVNDDECVDQWVALDEALSQVGMTRYEISNFAKTNCLCLHNVSYWRGGLYAGLGAGAHGHLRRNGARIRYSNGRDILGYLRETPLSVDAPVAGGSMEVLRPSQQAVELIMLGLRTAEGVHWPSVRRRLDTQKAVEMFDQEAHRVVKSGYASWKGDYLAPNTAGMLLADEIATWF